MKAIRKRDRIAKKVEKILKEHYLPKHPDAIIEAYRYESCLVRIRVIDTCFEGKGITDRDQEIWKIIEKRVPKEIINLISVLLLLGPKEMNRSAMNYEFDHPTPFPP